MCKEDRVLSGPDLQVGPMLPLLSFVVELKARGAERTAPCAPPTRAHRRRAASEGNSTIGEVETFRLRRKIPDFSSLLGKLLNY